MNKDNRSGLIAKNTLFMFIRMIIVMAIGVYTSRVLLNVLGVKDFGLYNVVGSVVMFMTFLRNALTNATQRYITYELGKGDDRILRKIFSMSFNVHLLLAFAIFVFLEFAGVWYINNKLVVEPNRLFAANIVFQASLISFCIDVIKVPYTSCVIAYERMSFFAWTSIVEAALKLAILFLLVSLPYDKLFSYAILLLVVNIIVYIWYYYYCRNNFRCSKLIICWDKKLFYSLVKFSGWSTMANGVDVATVQGYNLMFNFFFGVVTNAAYGISNQMKNLVASFVSNFSSAYTPQITKSYAAKDFVYFHKLVISSSKISGYLSLLIGIPIFLNVDYVLKIWLGDAPEHTADFLRITIFYTLFDMIQAPLTSAVYASGDIRMHQVLMTSIKLANLLISYILLLLGYSASSVLFCWVICNITCSIVRTIYLGYFMDIKVKKYFISVVGNTLLAIIISYPIAYYVYTHTTGFLQLFLSSSVAVIIVCVMAYLWGLEDFEKAIINNALRKYGIIK